MLIFQELSGTMLLVTTRSPSSVRTSPAICSSCSGSKVTCHKTHVPKSTLYLQYNTEPSSGHYLFIYLSIYLVMDHPKIKLTSLESKPSPKSQL